MSTTTQFIIAILVLVVMLYVYMFKHGMSLKQIFTTVFDFKDSFVSIRKQLTALGDKLDGVKDGKFTPDTIITSIVEKLRPFLRETHDDLKARLSVLGDKIDGVQDGKFDVSSVTKAVQDEVAKQVRLALKDVSTATSSAVQKIIKDAVDAQLADIKKAIAEQVAASIAESVKANVPAEPELHWPTKEDLDKQTEVPAAAKVATKARAPRKTK